MTAMIALLNEAQKHPGFEVAVSQDWGELNKYRKSQRMDELIADLQYVYNNLVPSPNYMRRNGRPVIAFFGIETKKINWKEVYKSVGSPAPLFVFENSGGFSDSESGGSFAWAQPTRKGVDIGLSYLDNFYKVGLSKPSEITVGTGYKGFNDSLASWGDHLKMTQQCGQTWLASFAEAGKYYSAGNQLENLQIVTWNDYEEGTEIETGIDNCITVVPALNWVCPYLDGNRRPGKHARPLRGVYFYRWAGSDAAGRNYSRKRRARPQHFRLRPGTVHGLHRGRRPAEHSEPHFAAGADHIPVAGPLRKRRRRCRRQRHQAVSEAAVFADPA